ncbi:MAG: HlyD family efflux transporter periplasmic adaptor subunit [Acutalibacteraceae bacterium]
MKGLKLLKVFLMLLSMVFLINQLISSLYKPIKTETVVYHTALDGIKITGYIIRDEKNVTSAGDGVLHFVTPDGNRVSKNGVIADIYTNESVSITVSKMDVLKAQIADIEDILSYNDIEAANLELLNTRVKEKLRDMIFASSAGIYKDMVVLSEDLLSAVNRKQAAFGVVDGLSERLNALKAELSSLTASLPAAKGKILAPLSGYFVSKTDGYENVLNPKELDKITPEYLANLSPAAAEGNVIGKIVSDYEWYIAAAVPINDSLKYKEGQNLKLETTVKSAPTLPVTVKKINISSKGDKAVIIFACSYMNSELAAMRSGVMTVVNKEYSGFKVPQKALRVVNSVRGVYVLNGMQIKFVPVNILYSTEDFMICEKSNENGNYLKLYDRVVIKGKNLYDGKVVG